MSVFGGLGYIIGRYLAIFIIIGILIIAGIVALIVYCCKSNKNSGPVQTGKVRVIEKLGQNGNAEWFGVEFENGARVKFYYTQGAVAPMLAGDIGIITYRGDMIETFQLLQRQ